MEGRLCAEERCHCADFLPFECSLCGNTYCLDHRSRFAHACSGMSVSQPLVRPPANTSLPSVKGMMSAVESRFDGVQNGSHEQQFHVKSSSQPETKGNEKFAKKLHALESSADKAASAKQRKIGLKTREMLIKSKAVGNSSISGSDRFFISVHFAPTMEEADRDPEHATEYLFFSGSKPIGEVLQFIWQKYPATIELSSEYRSIPEQHKRKREDVALVMCTADSPNWRHWDRNWTLQECLTNYEDIAVFATTVEEVLANQDAIAAAHYAAAHPPPPEPMVVDDDVPLEPAVYTKHEFAKGQLAWYHKVPAEVGARLSSAQMEQSQPMVLAKVSGVHHDDFPNVYYSVQMVTPPQFTAVTGSLDLAFTHEKQTDHTHLLPPSRSDGSIAPAGGSGAAASAPTATRNKAGDAASERAEQAAAAHQAALQLQGTLAAMGTPLSIRVGFSNKDYTMSIGTLCSVAQLKLLISAITDVPVPDMKLIVKGTVLKSNTQLIKDTKIGPNSRVVVMSSGAHVV